MKFKVTFAEEIEADSEEQAYEKLLDYLDEIVRMEDVTTFNFENVVDKS